jgi:hypothetical protein
MVETKIVKATRDILAAELGEGCLETVDHLFACRLLDPTKCRIALIKRYYENRKSVTSATQAKFDTAEAFHCSEKTVESIIYGQPYKAISFIP